MQNDVSNEEKRDLYTNEDLKIDDFIQGNAITKLEGILKDQFYLRSKVNDIYFKWKVLISRPLGKYNINGINLTVLKENVIELDDGYLMNSIIDYDEETLNSASSRGYNLNEMDLKYPNIKTYVYFPTKLEEILDSDNNYEPMCRWSFIRQLNENITYSSLQITSLEEYQKYFFKTDGHWNACGAYQGYKDIIEMIGNDYDIGPAKEIEEKIVCEYEFRGNISSQISFNSEADTIIDYKLKDLGDYTYYANEIQTDLNETKQEYIENGVEDRGKDYDIYFGDNFFIRCFDFNQENKPNLLIFGDSYINTNMSWIASHFNKTIILDLRARDEDFDLDKYIKDYDIDIILYTMPYHNMYINGNMFIPLN